VTGIGKPKGGDVLDHHLLREEEDLGLEVDRAIDPDVNEASETEAETEAEIEIGIETGIGTGTGNMIRRNLEVTEIRIEIGIGTGIETVKEKTRKKRPVVPLR